MPTTVEVRATKLQMLLDLRCLASHGSYNRGGVVVAVRAEVGALAGGRRVRSAARPSAERGMPERRLDQKLRNTMVTDG